VPDRDCAPAFDAVTAPSINVAARNLAFATSRARPAKHVEWKSGHKSLTNGAIDCTLKLYYCSWVAENEPDRGTFLVAIIGAGPIVGVMSQTDIRLLSD
jgi:hypothetical protein